VDTLLKPENKEMLTKVLTYHVVAGKMSSKESDKRRQRNRHTEDRERRHAQSHGHG